VESDIRFFRRRASEELAAAGRAVTESARQRRMILAGVFLEKLKSLEASAMAEPDPSPAFKWASARSAKRA
jgi:hypothetical protein